MRRGWSTEKEGGNIAPNFGKLKEKKEEQVTGVMPNHAYVKTKAMGCLKGNVGFPAAEKFGGRKGGDKNNRASLQEEAHTEGTPGW